MAESDLCASAADRLPKDPKPPEDGFDGLDDLDDLDEDDDEDDEDDERCDENPLLKDDELDGLASAGFDASDRIRDSANAACANFGMVFNMVRWAGES
jgi:hypothetical protein